MQLKKCALTLLVFSSYGNVKLWGILWSIVTNSDLITKAFSYTVHFLRFLTNTIHDTHASNYKTKSYFEDYALYNSRISLGMFCCMFQYTCV